MAPSLSFVPASLSRFKVPNLNYSRRIPANATGGLEVSRVGNNMRSTAKPRTAPMMPSNDRWIMYQYHVASPLSPPRHPALRNSPHLSRLFSVAFRLLLWLRLFLPARVPSVLVLLAILLT